MVAAALYARCGCFLLAGSYLAGCGASQSGPCVLHARAAIVSADAPINRELGSTTDVLVVRNDDSSDWQHVSITVYGRHTSPAKEKQPTGGYAYQLDRIESNKFRAVSLREFQKPDGGRWVSMTMAAEDVEVKATMNGASCRSQDVTLSTGEK